MICVIDFNLVKLYFSYMLILNLNNNMSATNNNMKMYKIN